MKIWKFLRRHRAWEDWLGIALGIMIILAPWLTKENINQAAMINATTAGLAVMMLSELEFVRIRRWAELGQLLCGIWVAASSLTFGYSESGALRVWHLALGLLVVFLAAFELWQSRLGELGATGKQVD